MDITYKKLNPTSTIQHIVFYSLYPKEPLGQKALQEALKLLHQKKENLSFPNIDLFSIIQIFIDSHPQQESLKTPDLFLIEEISKNLPYKTLPSKNFLKEEEFLSLPPKDIDIARALFISKNLSIEKIKYYEAILDMIALEVLSSLKKDATDNEKIKKLNQKIFFEMGFKYPPLSKYLKDIDSYTLLPSVLDTKKGICLGLCLLYASIAQRIGLEIEAVTIPGHIFLKHKNTIIETTKRGVHIPIEQYLSIETKNIQIRDNKELIGLTLINEASVYLKKQDFQKALFLYQKAEPYLKEDIFLKQLLGFCYLFTKEKKGMSYLKDIQNKKSIYSNRIDPLAFDFLKKRISLEGIKILFQPFEDTRKALLEKKEEVQKVLKKYPKFRSGYLLLANIWLNLGRSKEAKKCLKKCYLLNNKDPLITFYLCNISFQRNNFKKTWQYLEETKKILNYLPKSLENLQDILMKKSLFPKMN